MSSTVPNKILYLKNITRRLGGEIEFISVNQYDSMEYDGKFTPQPFLINHERLGLNWRDKKIFYVLSSNIHWRLILHEMGHLFACHVEPQDPLCKDMDFLGWEHLIFSKISTQKKWKKWNRYSINGTRMFQYDQNEFDSIMTDRRIFAEQAGLIIDNQPVAIR